MNQQKPRLQHEGPDTDGAYISRCLDSLLEAKQRHTAAKSHAWPVRHLSKPVLPVLLILACQPQVRSRCAGKRLSHSEREREREREGASDDLLLKLQW